MEATMARLTSNARNALAPSKFALPGGKFPVENAAHAVAAKRLVGRSVAAGNITPQQAVTVRHRADNVLGETDSTYHNMPGK